MGKLNDLNRRTYLTGAMGRSERFFLCCCGYHSRRCGGVVHLVARLHVKTIAVTRTNLPQNGILRPHYGIDVSSQLTLQPSASALLWNLSSPTSLVRNYLSLLSPFNYLHLSILYPSPTRGPAATNSIHSFIVSCIFQGPYSSDNAADLFSEGFWFRSGTGHPFLCGTFGSFQQNIFQWTMHPPPPVHFQCQLNLVMVAEPEFSIAIIIIKLNSIYLFLKVVNNS
jgi:hypothetical protein